MIIADNEVTLWLQPVGELAENPEKILNPKELQRYRGITSAGKRVEFLSSRLLLRKILDYYLPEKAASVHSVTDSFGRPFWYIEQQKLPLYFSLSHTKGIIACAIAAIPEIGCDIELIRPRRYESELAEKVLGKKEMRHYQKQKSKNCARRFFYRCWTLKEAFLKAQGVGIRESLLEIDSGCGEFSADFFSFYPEKQRRENWQFSHDFPTKNYSLALAIKSSSSIILQKNIFDMVSSASKDI